MEVKAKTTLRVAVRPAISVSRPGSGFTAMAISNRYARSGIAARLHYVESRQRILAALGSHSRGARGGSRGCGAAPPSYVEENLGQRDDVLQVEQPAQDHLDGQGKHREDEHHEHAVAPRAHLLVVLAQADVHARPARQLYLTARVGEKARQHADVEEHEQDARQLAHE